jgi:hypothetical protein
MFGDVGKWGDAFLFMAFGEIEFDHDYDHDHEFVRQGDAIGDRVWDYDYDNDNEG